MNIDNLVGQTFQETELYQLLLFDIKENFELYISKSFHLYFSRLTNKKIRISSITKFKDADEMDKKSRAIIEKQEWFNIYENCGHIDLMLVRFDRSGQISIVEQNETRTESSFLGWADETPHKRLKPEEMRQAFQELSGLMQKEQDLIKLRSKKAV